MVYSNSEKVQELTPGSTRHNHAVVASKISDGFCISNLLYYFMVDVVDSCFETLLKAVSAGGDFEGTVRAHQRFMSDVTRLCFVYMPALRDSVNSVLRCCLELTALIERSEDICAIPSAEIAAL